PSEFCILSLHDALPICNPLRKPFELLGADPVVTRVACLDVSLPEQLIAAPLELAVARPNRFQSRLDVLRELAQLVEVVSLGAVQDRKSTRLNSSHVKIS